MFCSGLFAGSPPLFYRDSLHGACCWGEEEFAGWSCWARSMQGTCRIGVWTSAEDQSANYNVPVPLSSPVASEPQQDPSVVTGEPTSIVTDQSGGLGHWRSRLTSDVGQSLFCKTEQVKG